MLFRNKSDDDRELLQGGVTIVTVARGETHVVTADEAPGFVLQCGPDGAWEPADDEATAAVTAAVAEADSPPEDAPVEAPPEVPEVAEASPDVEAPEAADASPEITEGNA